MKGIGSARRRSDKFHFRAITSFLSVLILAGMLGATQGVAQLPDTANQKIWVTNGTVEAIAIAEGTIYIGGNFSYVGPNTGQGIPIGAGTGSVIYPYPKVDGVVRAGPRAVTNGQDS